ncbi:hypothetical protein PR048_010027 [Dryococelus australis]|uniref:DDE-1 domain-containing protein n=1 Tax=Dryococelus australis TaxID=614101 RepID=A0ABQ9I1K6_9NEOP|nr:hypothetical protein PR048_010027 [Dryococelus australis]
MKPSKITAVKGMKQVGYVTSAEIGEMVTLTTVIRAIGNALPPIKGTATKSGWQTEEIFLMLIKNLIRNISPSLTNRVLLLLDNDSSHISCPVLDLCKANGVILLSSPPHCSHCLQPLDVSIYGPFKKLCGTGIKACLKTNTGRIITIFHLPAIVKEAFLHSMTPANITAKFQKTGISPRKVHTFSNEYFASTFATDRPLPCGDSKILQNYEVSFYKASVENNIDSIDERFLNAHARNGQEVNEIVHQKCEEQRRPLNLNNISAPSTSGFSPEIVHPFPKASKRNENPSRRLKKRKSPIVIDTPENKTIEEEEKRYTR